MPTLTINPSLIEFTHKQGDTLPPAFLINHNKDSNWTKSAPNLPVWLTMYDITDVDFKIKLNSFVDSLAAGSYNEAVEILAVDGDDELYATLFVNLELISTQYLEVSPGSASFNFIVGESNPAAKVFSVLSENSWTITKNATWLTLSITSGSNNGSFSVSVNAVGLTPGVYNDTVTVNDNGTSATISISLTVTDPDTGTDYLNIYPTVLNLGFTESGAVPSSKNIDINASAAYTVVTAQAWIGLSAVGGSAGTSTITVTLQNLAALSVGDHIAYIDFTLGTIVKRVTVYLTIYELVSETLTPGLYFADDTNNIKVSSARNDTNLLMIVNASYLGKIYKVPYTIPFFNGVASKRIGAEADNIIGDNVIFGMANISVFTPYVSVNVNIDINEIETVTDAVLQTISIPGLKFLKGYKPNTNWMSNVPRNLYVTKNATVIFSVLSNGAQSGDLVLDGDITQTIPTETQIFDYYTVVLPLKTLTSLIVGSIFTATLLGETITVEIKDDDLDHAMLYAETQWGTFESFELTGEVKEFSSYKDEVYTFRKDHLHSETKVFERKKRKLFKINTGVIYTDEMINHLDILLESKNFYLQTSSFFSKVRCTFKKLEVLASLRDFGSADLTFEDVIE